MNSATREIFGNISTWQQALFYALAGISIAIFVLGIVWRIRRWMHGVFEWRLELRDLPQRARHFFSYVCTQPRLRREGTAGSAHLLIFWGFLVLFVGTELVAVEHSTPLSFFHGLFYLIVSLATDLGGAAMLLGVGIAAYRRYVVRPERSSGASYGIVLAFLAVLGVSGFVLEGFRMALGDHYWFDWSLGGAAFEALVDAAGAEQGTVAAWHLGFWWFHAVVALAFVASIPFTRIVHAVTALLNIFFAPLRPKGALTTPFRLEQLEAGTEQRIGPQVVSDLSWKQLLSADACTECGLCQQACPAWASQRPLSPKNVILAVRDHIGDTSAKAWQTPLDEIIGADEAWSCTTCGACMEACPVSIEHIDFLVDVRRALVAKSRVDPNMSAALDNLRRTGNPFGMPPEQRLGWTAGLPVNLQVPRVEAGVEIEVLYWVGCAGAFDERGQRVARALAGILKRAGVKSGVLGSEERCTGDPARRLGEEGLFQQLVRENVATLGKYGVRRIVTQCPHCFNSLKNEYAEFGGRYEVVHHSEFISELIAAGRLPLADGHAAQSVTYHDSCYLGRHNGVYGAPREALSSVPGVQLREMPRNREQGFCCGAGGSNIWFDLRLGTKINAMRYEEAVATGAQVIATACPFCMTMFDDAASSEGEAAQVQIRDVAEIVNEACAG